MEDKNKHWITTMTDEIHFTVSLWFPLDAFVIWIIGVVV